MKAKILLGVITLGALAIPATFAVSTAQAQTDPYDAKVGSGPTNGLSMTCWPVYRGFVSDSPRTYAVVNGKLYNMESGDRILLSGPTLTSLGVTTDGRVRQESFARHSIKGKILTRTVYWKTLPNGKLRPRFTERYNFAAQTIMDKGGRDECNHNRRPNGG